MPLSCCWRLIALEGHASPGGRAITIPALLLDLVIITTRLAGRTWLEANADKAGAFTALWTTVHPPPLPELDHILACVLSDRFGLSRPRRRPRPAARCSPAC